MDHPLELVVLRRHDYGFLVFFAHVEINSIKFKVRLLGGGPELRRCIVRLMSTEPDLSLHDISETTDQKSFTVCHIVTQN